MDYLTATDKTIALGALVGLGVGLGISIQESVIAYWINQKWLGWDATLSKTVVSTIVWILMFGSATFLMLLYNAQQPLESINRSLIMWGLAIGLSFPSIRKLTRWLSQTVLKQGYPD